MKRWRCHEEAEAAKIARIACCAAGESGYVLVLEDGETRLEMPISSKWFERHKPQQGGYLVRYAEGYESYSPAEAFEGAYTPIDGGMSFGDAIRQLKDGKRVARAGWNGKGMWLALMPAFTITKDMINIRTQKFVRPDRDLNCGAYVVMWTAQGVWQPGWLPSQADLLAEDWELVE